jgi:hypothetical protein
MVFGILSVVSATSQHRVIGLLNGPLALRLWLSKGATEIDHRPGGAREYPSPYDSLPLESSTSASLVTQFPGALLNLAVFLYLVGFGLYLIFSWREAVPGSGSDYRNIFIAFIVAVGLSVLYYISVSVKRILEAKTRFDDFGVSILGFRVGGAENLQRLETTLAGFNQTRSINKENNLTEAIRSLTAEVTSLREAMANIQANVRR